MVEEISKEEADKLLAEKYGYFSEKKFKGSYFRGKYVCEFKKKFWKCDKLSEAAKIIG